jgi:hypothetical protein
MAITDDYLNRNVVNESDWCVCVQRRKMPLPTGIYYESQDVLHNDGLMVNGIPSTMIDRCFVVCVGIKNSCRTNKGGEIRRSEISQGE